jgi:hypothetical protein
MASLSLSLYLAQNINKRKTPPQDGVFLCLINSMSLIDLLD